jgi:hypothetical protein
MILSTTGLQTLERETIAQRQREQIKQVIRQGIDEALQSAKSLSTERSLIEVRNRLSAIQTYCQTVNKTFIVIEEKITCNQHNLGGYETDMATLFRGPSEDASVAICVTHKGSLLHRNGSPWTIYRNVGDVHPIA